MHLFGDTERQGPPPPDSAPGVGPGGGGGPWRSVIASGSPRRRLRSRHKHLAFQPPGPGSITSKPTGPTTTMSGPYATTGPYIAKVKAWNSMSPWPEFGSSPFALFATDKGQRGNTVERDAPLRRHRTPRSKYTGGCNINPEPTRSFANEETNPVHLCR